MKRLITAAGIAGAAMLGPTPAEAAPADANICADVYADTPQDVPAELRSVIGAYATNGISVHVQTLKNGGAKGIHGPGDTRPYAERLAAECNWDTENLVNVVVSDDPRTYAIYKSGNAATLITQSVTNAAEETFKSDLRNTSNSYFMDAAALLQTIDPYKKVQPPAAETPGKAEAAPTTEDNDSGFPVLYVGGGLLALAAAGAGGVRLRRGFDLRREMSAEDGKTSEIWSDVTTHVDRATQLVAALHADDAAGLRNMINVVNLLNRELDNERLAVLAAYKEQKGRVWPDCELMDMRFDTLRSAAKTVRQKATDLEATTAEVEDFIVNIEAMVTSLDERLQTTHDAADELVRAGWDLGGYNAKLDGFDGQQTQIAELRKKHYVERPGQMIEELAPQIEGLDNELTALPGRRADADQKYIQQPEEHRRLQTVVKDSKTALQTVRNTYDPSCFEDISSVDTSLDTLLQSLTDLHTEAAAYTGVKSLEAVEKSEAVNTTYAATTNRLNAEAQQAHDRLERLRLLENEIPRRISAVDTQLAATRTYAFETFAGDVEDDVREQLTALADSFGVTKQDAAKAKPAYLKLDSDLQTHSATVQRITQLAQSQKQEMDNLRSSIVNLEGQIRSELSSLQSYAGNSDVSSSVRTSAAGLSLAAANTRDTRLGLRGQVSDYESLRREVRNLHDRARSDVREAEAERERQRQAAEAAAAAAAAASLASQQAAQAASYSPPPSTNDSGTF